MKFKYLFWTRVRKILNDDSQGYSFESRVAVVRNRVAHPDGTILKDRSNPQKGILVETKTDGLAVYENSLIKIQHSLIDVKNNHALYKEWKSNNSASFLQRAFEAGIPLNTSSHDLLEFFLSISEDSFVFFKKVNKLIADDKGLNNENTGRWVYKTEDCVICYDDVFDCQ